MSSRTIGLSTIVCLLFSAAAPPQEARGQGATASATPSAAALSTTEAIVPRLIKFSGTLLDAKNGPMPGPVGVTFALYAQQSGGSALWMETQNVETDAKGNYNVLLGANSANGVPAELFTTGEARWLGVQPERQAEQPRVLLVSVPYALKAGDAQTLGGLPPSAFAPAISKVPASSSSTPLLLASPGPASPAAAPLTGTTPVTTGGLTSGKVPVADGGSDLKDSQIIDNGTTVAVGGCTPDPASKLDVCGPLELPSTGTAIAGSTGGKNSQPFDLFGSTFSSTLATAVSQHFRWQEEPVGQNTATPSGKVTLLYALGSAVPAETGLSISNKGVLTFAPGQTFPDPGDVKSVALSAPATDFTVSGSPVTSSGTLNFAWKVVPTNLNTANAIVKRDATGSFSAGAGAFSGNLSSGGTVFGAGGSFTGLNVGAGGLADVGGGSFGGNLTSGGLVSGAAASFSQAAGNPAPPIESITNTGDAASSISLAEHFRTWRVGVNRPPDALGVLDSLFFYDQNANATRMVIDTGGSVGIGTFFPDQKLTVAGAIESTTGGFKFPAGNIISGDLWAVVNSDGTLARGSGATASSLLFTGEYEVDFARDVTACAYVATPGLSGSSNSQGPAFVGVVGRSGVASGIFVTTFDSTGASSNQGFHIHVLC